LALDWNQCDVSIDDEKCPRNAMRLRDDSKEKHEHAVANVLLEKMGISSEDPRPGDPSRDEPDRLCTSDKRVIGIEVVTAYYSKKEAQLTAEAAAERPMSPGEMRFGKVMGGPDAAICESIQKNLDAKCARKYTGADETWLCINVDAFLTDMTVLQECIENLEVPKKNHFTKIFVLVANSEGELGGLFEVAVKKE
jgi:hypothetical protein